MSASAGASPWVEYRNPQGRPYWYNTVDKRSVWEKPVELKTPRERALDATPWKEYKSGDRSYYVHSETKQSTWTIPPELKELFEKYPETTPSPALASPLARQSPLPTPVASAASPIGGASTPIASSSLPPRPPPSTTAAAAAAAASVSSPMPELNFRGDKEAAEAAFISLLEEKKVDVDWTWEVTMRAIITEPLYKALKTIAERKAAFNKYIDRLRSQRQQERAERLDRLQPTLHAVIDSDSRIKPYSSFAAARKVLVSAHPDVWRQFQDEDEARAVFDAAMRAVRDDEQKRERDLRQRNTEMLRSLLKTFETDVFTRWRDAQRTVIESEEYESDPHLRQLDVSDMLAVFEEHMRSVEKEAADAAARRDAATRRAERKNRDAFRALLAEMRDRGDITAASTWAQVFEQVRDDDRFLRLVGQPGSTPLDLFYDLLDQLDRALEQTRQSVLARMSAPLTAQMTFDDFIASLAPASGPELSRSDLQIIYTQVRPPPRSCHSGSN